MTNSRYISFLELHHAVLLGMATKPKSLAKALDYHAEDVDGLIDEDATQEAFTRHLDTAGVTDQVVELWRKTLTNWDYAESPAWSTTEPLSTERRADVYSALKVGQVLQNLLNSVVPVATAERPVVISDRFEEWYTDSSKRGREFYWPAYRRLLESKGWSENAIEGLNLASDSVVERLSDPAREEAYQSKGLVVGYVQSGKTANFTGVIAKAVDAGYRLVIVLGGTLNMLRSQTQRRLDMELVGRENILRGASEIESDYADDNAWLEDGFTRFGDLPSALGGVDIVRMTTRDNDYKSLLQGIVALEFEKVEPRLPLYDTRNLHRSSARLMVVKKNKTVLGKLVKDLNKIKTPLAEIPVLIVDDESDEASVNTRDLSKPNAERTAINQKISELLRLLPRAQYVGYTATPFANVFIDPSDTEDIFPKDFLISLPRPERYMGVQDFHDLNSTVPEDEKTVENSNEKAYVRDIPLTDDDGDGNGVLREAIDAFVLSAAIKMYRTEHAGVEYKHHTMLIHESMRTADHREILYRVKSLWLNAGYTGPAGHARLEHLFEHDYREVSSVRADGYPVPPSYRELRPYIGAAFQAIGGDGEPVIVVNGDKDIETGEADFDRRRIWKILVGGQKLSRGFTVEGLTVTYFRRAASSASTLMQMGRWFGFREGYRDLVRLYLGRGETMGAKVVDLYDAFEAICYDEERFREELKKYAKSGTAERRRITPGKVPPLVSQHLSWLPPVAKTKMFNARLIEVNSAGEWQEPTAYPTKVRDLAVNFELWRPFYERLAGETMKLSAADGDDRRVSVHVRAATATPSEVLDVFERVRWLRDDQFAPHLAFLRSITESSAVDDWLVVAPQHATATQRAMLGGDSLSWFSRKRRVGRQDAFGAISSPRERVVLTRTAMGVEPDDDAATAALVGPKRGVIVLYPVVEPHHVGDVKRSGDLTPETTVAAFSFVAPSSARPRDGRVLRFTTIDSSKVDTPIIDAR